VADREDHGHHDEAETETNANARDSATTFEVDSGCAGARENEGERPESLGKVGRKGGLGAEHEPIFPEKVNRPLTTDGATGEVSY
jgi:hypothetical protein